MSKKDLRNEEILEKEEQLNEEEEILEEEVEGNCRHVLPCLTNTKKKCSSNWKSIKGVNEYGYT